MTVRWSREAIAHLLEIRDYIAREDPRAASRVARLIRERVLILDRFPCAGRLGRLDGTRELVIPGTPYFVPYTIDGGDVILVAVIHGARQWP
jgi:toxin ParE1/3/4